MRWPANSSPSCRAGHRAFVQEAPQAPTRRRGSAGADILGRVDARSERHSCGRVGGCGAGRGRAARPPAPTPPAARGHRRRRRGAARAVRGHAPLAPARRRRGVPADVRLRHDATRCPTTTPSACARGCACDYPVRADRIIGLGELPGLRLQRAFARRGRAARARAGARVVPLAVVRRPARDGRLPALRAGAIASRAAPRRSTRSSTSASSATGRCRPPRRGTRPSRARWAARDAGMRRMMREHGRGGLEGRLGASLRCPGRQPSRRHALAALRHIRDGRPRPQRRGAGRRARWAGPMPSRSGSRSSTSASTTSSTWSPGWRWPRACAASGPRAAPALRAVSRTLAAARGAGARMSSAPVDEPNVDSTGGRRRRGDAARGHHARAGCSASASSCSRRSPSCTSSCRRSPAWDVTSIHNSSDGDPVAGDRARLRVRCPSAATSSSSGRSSCAATRAIDWRASYEITMAGVAATRLFAAAGAGGVALTAWALRRSGMRAPSGGLSAWSPSSRCSTRSTWARSSSSGSGSTSASSTGRPRSPSRVVPAIFAPHRVIAIVPGHVAAARRRRAAHRAVGRRARGAARASWPRW